MIQPVAICFQMLLHMDSLQAVERLTESGLPENQAKAIVETLMTAELNQVATKQDLLELKADIFKWSVPLLLGQFAAFSIIVSWLAR